MSDDPEFDRDVWQDAAELAAATGKPVEEVWRSIATRLQLEAEVDRLRAALADAQRLAAAWEELADARASLLADYRVGRHPTEALLARLDIARVRAYALSAEGGGTIEGDRCGANHPDNPTVVPCCLKADHNGDHYSTTGCAGSGVLWAASSGRAADTGQETG